MPLSTVILNPAAMRRALTRIAHEIAERNEISAEVALVGIQRGGVVLARRDVHPVGVALARGGRSRVVPVADGPGPRRVGTLSGGGGA